MSANDHYSTVGFDRLQEVLNALNIEFTQAMMQIELDTVIW